MARDSCIWYFFILDYFLPFYPHPPPPPTPTPLSPKTGNFKKTKNESGGIINLQIYNLQCAKNHDYIIYCS